MSTSSNEPDDGSGGNDDGAAPPYPPSNPYANGSGSVPPPSANPYQDQPGQQYPGQYGQQLPGQYGQQYQPYPSQYGQQYGQQPGYYPGQPMYMAPPPSAPKNLSITSLVLGVASIMGFAFFLVPQVLAVVFGHLGLKREPGGRGMAIAGLVTGYICIAGWLAVVLLYAGLIGIALNTSEISGSYNS